METLLSPLYFVKKPISRHIAESNENADNFYQYMWGSRDDGSSYKKGSYEGAPFLEILTPAEVRYLIKTRSKLFDLKIKILRKLIEPPRAFETTNLIDNCLRLLAETLTEDKLKFLVKIDSRYIESEVYPGRDHVLWHRPVTGGITDLLEVIGHYYKELTIGTFAKTRKALGQIISFDRLRYASSKVSEITSPYFKYVALGNQAGLG